MNIDLLNARLGQLRHRWAIAAVVIAVATLAAWAVGFLAGLVVVWFNGR